MNVVIMVSVGVVLFLIVLTFFYFRKQKKLSQTNLIHKSKNIPKYDILETSDDTLYYEYYEPKIIQTVPMEESAK